MLRSNFCKQEQLESEEFRQWCQRVREDYRLHRKTWEFCYIAQALHERGMLAPGKRGLGFGVGREPLAAMFATYGCEVVGTDMDPERAHEAGWVGTLQHSANLEGLNERDICDPETFRRLVSFQCVDMNSIPRQLKNFDFTWSSCAFEHLGSIDLGKRFVERQMDCLNPGGIAVHTTELNLSSNEDTIDNNNFLVLFRRRDIEHLARRLTRLGHEIDLDLSLGNRVADNHVDLPPYKHPYCLRIEWDRFVTTSIGLIIQKSKRKSGARIQSWVQRLLPTWLPRKSA
jgi:2-polyprenyl-3-methyl-5-hydroxy-6-metoxy-1,4-benzoquinol methylase